MARINNLLYTDNPLRGASDASGIYRARVEDVEDPLGIGRVRVRIPKFHGLAERGGYSTESLPWATMISNSAGYNYGSFIVPEVGEYVLVQFEDEDTQKPVYLGSLYGVGPRRAKEYKSAGVVWSSVPRENEVPRDAQRLDPSKKVVYKSPKGAEISVDEMSGGENVEIRDTMGQSIILSSPLAGSSTPGHPVSTGESHVIFNGAGGQVVDISTSGEEATINLNVGESNIALIPRDSGTSISCNGATVTIDPCGAITVGGGLVQVLANTSLDLTCNGDINILGRHVTLGYDVSILESGSYNVNGTGYVPLMDFEGLTEEEALEMFKELGVDADVALQIIAYYQTDPRWADAALYTDAAGNVVRTVSSSGCGFTSMAMIASYFTGTAITPDQIAAKFNNHYIYGQGCSFSLMSAVADSYGFNTVYNGATFSTENAVKELQKGNPVVVCFDKGKFTGGGHVAVVTGVTKDGGFIVNDPNKSNEEKYGTVYSAEDMSNNVKAMWSFSG